jgi:hypothetical protein
MREVGASTPMTGDQGTYDWDAIERSPEFRALVSDRARWTAVAGGVTMGLCAAYIVVAYLAPDVLGSALGWAGGRPDRADVDRLVRIPAPERRGVGPVEEAVGRAPSGRFERTAERERVS